MRVISDIFYKVLGTNICLNFLFSKGPSEVFIRSQHVGTIMKDYKWTFKRIIGSAWDNRPWYSPKLWNLQDIIYSRFSAGKAPTEYNCASSAFPACKCAASWSQLFETEVQCLVAPHQHTGEICWFGFACYSHDPDPKVKSCPHKLTTPEWFWWGVSRFCCPSLTNKNDLLIFLCNQFCLYRHLLLSSPLIIQIINNMTWPCSVVFRCEI